MNQRSADVEAEYPTNEGDMAVVVEYVSYEHVLVTFKSDNTPLGFTVKCQLGDLRRGRVKNPYKRQIYGIGYKGMGRHVTAINGNNTKCWHSWRNMLSRCYNKNNKSYLNYGGVGITVCSEWHNFQNFADWYTQHEQDGWEIDKDVFGGSEYSPYNCVMLPKELNSFFKNKTLNYADNGVSYDGSKHVAQVTYEGIPRGLGKYKTKEQAIAVFRKEKQKMMREKLEKFRQYLNVDIVHRLEEIINAYI
jgi:hypothetical protein